MHFLHVCTDVSKKPKSVKIISMYASESSHYTLSENDWFIGVWAENDWFIGVWAENDWFIGV